MYALYNHENVDVRNDIMTRGPSHVPGQKRKSKENATDQHCRQDDEHKTRCGGRAGPGRGGAAWSHGYSASLWWLAQEMIKSFNGNG